MIIPFLESVDGALRSFSLHTPVHLRDLLLCRGNHRDENLISAARVTTKCMYLHHKSKITSPIILIQKYLSVSMINVISNGNITEWSPIWSVQKLIT